MKILIINNGTSYITQLITLVCEFSNDVTVLSIETYIHSQLDLYDLYILSGSNQYPIYFYLERYKEEISLIHSSKKPIIGICLGFELIAYAYGSKLERLQEKIKGYTNICIPQNMHLTSPASVTQVYVSHRWIVKDISKSFDILAYSIYGAEMIKHKKKHIYGLQFHPEKSLNNTQGKILFSKVMHQIQSS